MLSLFLNPSITLLYIVNTLSLIKLCGLCLSLSSLSLVHHGSYINLSISFTISPKLLLISYQISLNLSIPILLSNLIRRTGCAATKKEYKDKEGSFQLGKHESVLQCPSCGASFSSRVLLCSISRSTLRVHGKLRWESHPKKLWRSNER